MSGFKGLRAVRMHDTTWRPLGLSKSVIIRVIIGVSPLRVLYNST